MSNLLEFKKKIPDVIRGHLSVPTYLPLKKNTSKLYNIKKSFSHLIPKTRDFLGNNEEYYFRFYRCMDEKVSAECKNNRMSLDRSKF